MKDNYSKNKHCKCGKKITNYSTLCFICAKQKEKHPNWKGGKPKCMDCGKELSTRNHKNRTNKRCVKCYFKWFKLNAKNFNYPDRKGINNSMYNVKLKNKIIKHHIDLDNKNNNKNNLLLISGSLHTKLHHFAYNYLVDIGLIKKYLKWFKKNYITKGIKNE